MTRPMLCRIALLALLHSPSSPVWPGVGASDHHAGAPGGTDGAGYDTSNTYAYDDLNLPPGWRAGLDPERRTPRSCRGAAQMVCEQEYLTCQLYAGPANDAAAKCLCAQEFYGVCLREAGCAAHRFTDCVDELMASACSDASVCGSNCVSDGNGLDLAHARVLPVNNYAANFLRLSVCDAGVDGEAFRQFGLVRVRRCRDPGPGVKPDETFQVCPYWVPPSTFTAVAIAPNASYLRVEYANYVAAENVAHGHRHDEFNATVKGARFAANVLRSPPPLEYYGTPALWPSSVDVEFSATNFCHSNADCPGSTCNRRTAPPKCAPKQTKHWANDMGQFKAHSYTEETV